MNEDQITQGPGPAQSIPTGGTITDKRKGAPGVLPKQVQSWILIGVAALIVLVVWLSGGSNSKPAQPAAAAPAQQNVSGLSPEDIARNLAAAEQNRQADMRAANQTQPTAANSEAALVGSDGNSLAAQLAQDERKREYQSRFSSNIAMTYRQSGAPIMPANPAANMIQGQPTAGNGLNNLFSQPPVPTGSGSGTPSQFLPANDPPSQGPSQPDPMAQGLGAMPDPQQQLPSLPAYNPLLALAPQQPPQPAAPTRKPTTELNQASGKDYVIFEGTVLESALVNRLNGDFSGPVICMLTNDLYSHDHSRVLIPAGTKILGESKKVDSFGQTRLAVAFHRLIMPDGYSVDLDQFPGLNQIGETALKDKVNNHYLKIFGASIAIGAIAGLATIGTNTAGIGTPVSNGDAYRQGFASSMSQSSLQILDKFLNQLPTITIREGHRVKVYLMQDLKVPDYQHHQMSPDL